MIKMKDKDIDDTDDGNDDLNYVNWYSYEVASYYRKM